MRAILAALVAGTMALPASGANLATYETVRAGLRAVWDELPLTAAHVILTAGPATGYGAYTVHAGRSYAPGEPIYVYFELLGYGLATGSDGLVTAKVDVDLELLDATGNVLTSRQNVTTLSLSARTAPLETYLSLSGTLGGFAAGDYTLRYKLHDRIGGKDGVADVAVTLMPAAGEASSASAPASN